MIKTKYRLKEIAIVKNGSTPSTDREDFYDGDICWITPKDLSDSKKKYIAKGQRSITLAGFNSCSTSLLPPRSILLSSRAPIGLLAIASDTLCTNQGFKNLVLNENKINNEYLYYWLKTQIEYISSLGTGTTFKEVSKSVIEDLIIELPENINAQFQIAKVLSDLDAKIELNNRINAELEAMAKLIYDYWFVQFDFPNEVGKPYKSSGGKMVWNAELKREIPEGWEVKTLSTWIEKDKSGDWGKEEREGNYTERVYCLRGADLNGLNGKGEVKAPERFILEKNAHKMLDSHDLIVEISGGSPTQSTGRMAYITDGTLERFDAPVICSNFCKAVTLKDEKSLYNFAFEWNKAYDHGVLFGYEGKTSGIKNLLFESFVTSYYTPIPSKHLLEKFYDFMTPLESRKQKNLLENQKLSELRDWLLPMLMNGQVKVDKLGDNEEQLNMAAEEREKYR
jgi:type I restriction enzyme, S subunit